MTLYLSIAGTYFSFLLLSILRKQESLKIDRISWLIAILASAFWILVIPISLLEISFKVRAKSRADIKRSINSQVNNSQVVLVKQNKEQLSKELDINTSTRLTAKNT